MTIYARVPMSEIAKSGRIDPGFHIAAQRMASQVAALEQHMTADAAVEAALKIAGVMEPAQLRSVLDPIRRSEGNRSVDDKELARLAKDYPYLALALLVEGAPKAQEALQERLKVIQAQQDTLVAVVGQVAMAGTQTPKAKGPAAR